MTVASGAVPWIDHSEDIVYENKSPATETILVIFGLAANIAQVTALFTSYFPVVVVSGIFALIIGLGLIVKGWRSRQRKALIFGLIVSLVGAGASGFWLNMHVSRTTAECTEPVAATEYPRDHESLPAPVARQFRMKAQLTGPLCGGTSLWAFVRLPAEVNPTYFQQEGPCVIHDLTIDCGTIGIVRPSGTSADILVYKVDSGRLRSLVDVEIQARIMEACTASAETEASEKPQRNPRASSQPLVPDPPLLELAVSIQ